MKAAQENCLNCGSKVAEQYCPACGQKNNVHRLSITHFALHDMLHGIWHLDRGILFTLKEILTRPGYVAHEYIAGKRTKYYNFFSLFILTIALNFFINSYIPAQELDTELQRFEAFFSFLDKNARLLLFLLLPFMALSSFLVFKKLRYNYTEHLIPPLLLLIVSLIIDTCVSLTGYVVSLAWIENGLEVYLFICFGIFTYYQFTRNKYAFSGFLWRILVALLLFFVMISVLLYFGEWYWRQIH